MEKCKFFVEGNRGVKRAQADAKPKKENVPFNLCKHKDAEISGPDGVKCNENQEYEHCPMNK